jgi:chromosome segregation ATPase
MKIQTQIIKWLFKVDVESLQAEIIKLTNSSAQLLKDLTEAKSTICNINNQKEELQNQHHNYIVEKQTLLNDKREMYKQLNEAQKSLAEKHNQLTEKLMQIETYAQKVDALNEQLAEQKEVIANCDECIKGQEDIITHCKEDNKWLSKQCQNLSLQLDEVTEEFEATEKLLSQEVKSYKLQLENKLKDVEKLIGQIDEKNLVIAYDNTKINELTECVSKLECTIKEQKSQMVGYAKNVSALQKQLNESYIRFDEAQKRIKKYEEDIKLVVDVAGEEYRSSLDAKDGLIQAVSNDLSEKSRLINKLREDVSKLKREKNAMQDEISQYKKNLKDLGNQLKTRTPEARLIDSLYSDIERERISNNSLKKRLKERDEKIIALQKEVDDRITLYKK